MEKYAPKTKSELRKLLANPEINLGDIDTSAITDMSNLFGSDFEDDLEFFRLDFSGIENWDTSHVENMSQMFEGIPYFNEPIGKWDVSHVKNMVSSEQIYPQRKRQKLPSPSFLSFLLFSVVLFKFLF